MEKSAVRTKSVFCFGLLVFIMGALFAQSQKYFTYADAQSLLIQPKSELIFTRQDVQFTLFIPDISSGEVQMELQKFPEGVNFISSRREDAFNEKGERGTNLDLWINFRSAQEVTLPPLVLYVQNRRFLINFKTVKVYEDPQTILPRIMIKFESGEFFYSDDKTVQSLSLEAGVPVNFTIYLQYGIQLQQFAWTIPKDSLFREVKRFETDQSKNRRTSFSTEKIPVASFEWVPFEQGKFSLPDIRLMVTAYSGRAVYITVPECTVTVAAPSLAAQVRKPEADSAFFDNAFTPGKKIDSTVKESAPDAAALENIAGLRSLERNSLVQNHVREQRIAEESKLGIQNAPPEPSVPFLFINGGMFLLFALCAFILFLLRKRQFAAISASLALIFALLIFMFSYSVFDTYAIVTGGFISPVPEDSALTKTAAGEGSRVLVREEIDGWYYIEHNESRGWIKKENLVIIK